MDHPSYAGGRLRKRPKMLVYTAVLASRSYLVFFSPAISTQTFGRPDQWRRAWAWQSGDQAGVPETNTGLRWQQIDLLIVDTLHHSRKEREKKNETRLLLRRDKRLSPNAVN